MSSTPELKFEIGHVLFIDIVGYSKLLINEQSEQIQNLQKIVRGTEQFHLAVAEGKLLRLPTGDGGALVFRNSLEAPVLCALEIAKALKNHPELYVRMGIHSGPVNEIVDLNEQSNVAGAGINIAQRVMDCGDAGHILISKRVAEDLEHYPQWRSLLHGLGECEVKHGLRISIVNLYDNGSGNPELPQKFRQAPGAPPVDQGFWVAVLPFIYRGDNSDLTALAEGLTEDIVTGLSRFSYLKVMARSSTSRFASESVDVRSAGNELGARYVMGGSLRPAGAKLRLAVQLVDASSGAHLWAETYERSFSPETIFELQDDLVPRIVSTVADRYGVLSHNMSELVRSKTLDQLTPYEALLRSIGYGYRLTPEEHATARTCMERAVQQAPGYADGWAMLSLLYSDEYGFEFNAQPDPLGRALQAARRATDAAPSNSLAQTALAKTLFFRKEFQAFRIAAEQAISLNPMDGAHLANVGSILAYSGDWDGGCAMIERAMQLNPRYPAWYWFPFFYNAYRQHDYRGALSVALKINLPGFFAIYETLAAVYGQLGERDAASQSLREMLKLIPSFGEIGRALKSKWFDPELVEHLLDGLRKAGLEIAGAPAMPSSARPQAVATGNQAKSIAVLPFVNMSQDKNDEYLSDGMTEELINALARVPGLRVPGRTSCFAFKGKTEADIFRKVGDQLQVDTVLEGSVRKAGDKLRITAQLVNVGNGYHLWSEDYDGDVKDIFTFQSNVAQRVVEALQIKLGVEAARALAKKPTENPEAHRLYLLGRYEFGKYSEAGWTSSIRYYEQALKLDPNYALAYCGLADTYAYMGGVVMPSKQAVAKEKEFAQKAIELEPQLAEAHLSLACAFGGAFDWRNAQVEFERAIELNPNLAWAYEIYAWFLGGLGRLDEAIASDKKAIELDPLNSFFQAALAYFLYHARRYDEAMVQIQTTLELDPASMLARHLLGCCLLWKGDTAGAIAEFQKSKIMVTGAWYQGLLGYAYAISGNQPKAGQILRELEEMAKRQYVNPSAFAAIYLGLGEKEKALDWLDKAYQNQESACWLLKVDPIYDCVRNESRFQALIEKIFSDHQVKIDNFFAELKRRNVYKVAVAYAVVAWLLIQAASILLPTFEAPGWVMKVIVMLVALGFPVALIFSWAFEITPEGIKLESEIDPKSSIARRTGRKIVAVTIGLAVVAIGLFVYQIVRSVGIRQPPTGPSALLMWKKTDAARAASLPVSNKSIAVLPFDNLSRDPDNAYFCEGVQDEILTRLAKVADLKVISRTSTQHFKSTPDNLPQIAKQLGVAHIVEGSVQKAGDQVRVNVQLINAMNDAHLWAETYDRKLTDIFAVESEIAKTIAETLQAKLTGSEKNSIAKKPTENPEAYELYLKGRFFWNKRTGDDLRKSIEYLKQAIAKDPNYALAYAALADSYGLLRFYGGASPEESIVPANGCGEESAGAGRFVSGAARFAWSHRHRGTRGSSRA